MVSTPEMRRHLKILTDRPSEEGDEHRILDSEEVLKRIHEKSDDEEMRQMLIDSVAAIPLLAINTFRISRLPPLLLTYDAYVGRGQSSRTPRRGRATRDPTDPRANRSHRRARDVQHKDAPEDHRPPRPPRRPPPPLSAPPPPTGAPSRAAPRFPQPPERQTSSPSAPPIGRHFPRLPKWPE